MSELAIELERAISILLVMSTQLGFVFLSQISLLDISAMQTVKVRQVLVLFLKQSFNFALRRVIKVLWLLFKLSFALVAT